MTTPYSVSPRGAGDHLLLAIDPGGKRRDASACGVALALVTQARAYLMDAAHLPRAAVYHWAQNHERALPLAIVCETPHAWGGASHDLGGVTKVKATVAYLKASRPLRATWMEVRPHAWKGNVPKATHHRRVAVVIDGLDLVLPAALVPGSSTYQHDTADAIALALWATGRTGRGGVS